jgi:hypothetical protein
MPTEPDTEGRSVLQCFVSYSNTEMPPQLNYLIICINVSVIITFSDFLSLFGSTREIRGFPDSVISTHVPSVYEIVPNLLANRNTMIILTSLYLKESLCKFCLEALHYKLEGHRFESRMRCYFKFT